MDSAIRQWLQHTFTISPFSAFVLIHHSTDFFPFSAQIQHVAFRITHTSSSTYCSLLASQYIQIISPIAERSSSSTKNTPYYNFTWQSQIFCLFIRSYCCFNTYLSFILIHPLPPNHSNLHSIPCYPVATLLQQPFLRPTVPLSITFLPMLLRFQPDTVSNSPIPVTTSILLSNCLLALLLPSTNNLYLY